jgi:hypothetical protein
MKFAYSFLFLIILSCSTVKKEYVCGDHPCLDKKEFNEYFSKNLIIEIKSQPNKKNKKINLVDLNMGSLTEKKSINVNNKKEEQIKLKEDEKNSLVEKVKLSEKRKKKEEDKARKIIEEVKTANILKSKEPDKSTISEISNNRDKKKKIASKTTSKIKKSLIKNTKETSPVDVIKTEKIESICDQIKDCDIDKITDSLIKKGRKKPFPNIASY